MTLLSKTLVCVLVLRLQVQVGMQFASGHVAVVMVMVGVDIHRHQIQLPVAHAPLRDHGIGEGPHGFLTKSDLKYPDGGFSALLRGKATASGRWSSPAAAAPMR